MVLLVGSEQFLFGKEHNSSNNCRIFILPKVMGILAFSKSTLIFAFELSL